MKKIMMLALAVLVFASMAMAQYTGTPVSGGISMTIDNLGAHQNGGRGCAGCHAPHSGARGNGGTLTAASVYGAGTLLNGSPGNVWNNQPAVTDPTTGDLALWGQDIGPITSGAYAAGITVGGSLVTWTNATAAGTQPKILTGIIFCLSCHDGNVAKGAMMTNQSYEQAAGLLPSNYGSLPIPTLLGNDGTGAGNYANDHPIGPAATLAAVGSHSGSLTPYVTYVPPAGAASGYLELNAGASPLATFQQHYGLPQVLGGFVVDATVTSAGAAYVVCTTCHNQHSMYVYTSSAPSAKTGTTGIAVDGGGKTYPTYFFINAPYNPGANVATGMAGSATQFCRQCHFGESNEFAGVNGVTTQF